MDKTKNICVGIFLCIFFIYSGVTVEHSLVHKIITLLKLQNTNKITVAVNNIQAADSFDLWQVKLIKSKLKAEELFAMSEAKEDVTYDNRCVECKVTGISPNLENFYDISISTGSFINESTSKENKFCAVIEDRLAHKLFGNENVEGLKIKILNKDFKIIGVVKRDSNIIQDLSEDGFDKVYIPIETLTEINSKAKISYLQFQNFDSNISEKNKERVVNLLEGIGKSSKKYSITDFNKEKKIMEQKPLILSFALGIYCIYFYAKYVKNRVFKIFNIFIIGTKEEYFLNLLKKFKKSIIIYLIEIIAAILTACILLYIIKFDLYIPAKYIPDKIIDIAYYKNVFRDMVKENIISMDYLKPFMELKFMKVNMLINILSVLIITSMFVLNNFIRRFLFVNKDAVKLIRCCGRFSILGVIFTGCVIERGNCPFVMSLKYWLVIWIFIFTKVLVQALDIKN